MDRENSIVKIAPTFQRNLIRWMWWAAFVGSILLVLGSLPGYVLHVNQPNIQIQYGIVQSAAAWMGLIFSLATAILCLGLALLLFLRKPDEPMALFLSFFILVYGSLFVGPLELFLQYWLPQLAYAAIIIQISLLPFMFITLILIFPNGRFYPGWTSWLVWVTAGVSMAAFMINPDDLVRMSGLNAQTIYGLMLSMIGIAIIIQVYRYRTVYTVAEQLQTKWVLVGLGVMVVLESLVSIPYYYMLNLPVGTPVPWWSPLSSAFWWLSLMILPLSFTISILRFRLFDIDVFIRKTLVYGLLTASLALLYFGLVTLLQSLSASAFGLRSPVVIVLSTLAIAALFNPLRLRIQNLIDRRFYRSKYDAEKALVRFSVAARNETDIECLNQALLEVVNETIQPESVSLWLKPAAKQPALSAYYSGNPDSFQSRSGMSQTSGEGLKG